VIGTYPQFKGQNSRTGVFKLLSSILVRSDRWPRPQPGAEDLDRYIRCGRLRDSYRLGIAAARAGRCWVLAT
jgi:hypothetical protein